MALLSAKTLFLHVPKTGGTTVRLAMAAAGLEVRESGVFDVEDHYSLAEVRAAHPGIDDGRLTFGFVRHPAAWLRSRWAWAVVTGFGDKIRTQPDAAAHWMAQCWSGDFHRFVSAYLDRYPGICTQTMFRILGLWCERPAIFVGKTEALASDLAIALEMADESFDPRALNVERQKVAADGEFVGRCTLTGREFSRVMQAEAPLCQRFSY